MAYEETRKTLWDTKAALEAELESVKSSISYHDRELITDRTKCSRLAERIEQLKIAAEALGSMDDAGIVMTAKTLTLKEYK